MSDTIYTAEELLMTQEAAIEKLQGELDAAREFVASEVTALKDRVGTSLTQNISDLIATTEKRLSEFEKGIGETISEREKAVIDSTRESVRALKREIESTTSQRIEDTAKAFELRIAQAIESTGAIRREFEKDAEVMLKRTLEAQPKPNGFLDIFRGNWTKDLPLKRGELFGFRGSTYVALRDVVGEVPTRQLQTGPNPTYQIVAATGAPGPQGQPGTNGSGGSGINWVTAPTNYTDSGTAGQVAYDGFYFYVCISSNLWGRTPLGSW